MRKSKKNFNKGKGGNIGALRGGDVSNLLRCHSEIFLPFLLYPVSFSLSPFLLSRSRRCCEIGRGVSAHLLLSPSVPP